MKIKTTYLYHAQEKTKFIDCETVTEHIRNRRYSKFVEALRERIEMQQTLHITNGAGHNSPLPLINWAAGDTAGGYTGLVTVTIPATDSETADSIRSRVTKLPQVFAAYTGSSGRTLKIIVPYRLTDDSLPTEKNDIKTFHATAYQSCALFFAHLTGITPTGEDGDWTRGSRISCDKDIYFNPDAMPLAIEQPTDLPSQLSLPKDVTMADTASLPNYTQHQMEVINFDIICSELDITPDMQPEDYVHELASACLSANIDKETAVKCLLAIGRNRDYEMLIRNAFEVIYNKGKKKETKKNGISKTLIHLAHLRKFVGEAYYFRRNELTDSVEYIEKNRYITSWRPLNNRALNSICIAAHNAGIEAWDNDLRRYIDSNLIADYDPIAEWLNDLPEWDGTDRIKELADTVPTSYANWEEHFRLWLRSMVSQWTKRNSLHSSSTVLMLIGAQGTGKSTFFRSLLPEELSAYYNDRIDFTSKREAERALMRFALICMDEFDQITPSQTAYLKHILQKSDIKYRKLYQDEIEQRNRYATFCATTNSLQPLTDPTGSRRYLCVELTDRIDSSYVIDHRQLFAQILNEIRRGEKAYFDNEAETIIQSSNQEYTQEQPLEAMLLSMFSPAPEASVSGNNPDVLSLTAVEILTQLKTKFRNQRIDNASTVNLGKLLVNKKFPRHRTKNGWRYFVIKR